MIALGTAGSYYVAIFWGLPLWIAGRRNDAIDLTLLIIMDGLLLSFVKGIFEVPRPDIGVMLAVPLADASGYSFPSGHTTRAFAAALILSIRLDKTQWRVTVFGLAAAVGISRVYVGAHWPADIAAGVFFGMTWSYAFERGTRLRFYSKWRSFCAELAPHFWPRRAAR